MQLTRCGTAQVVPIADVRDELLAANQQLSEQGLRVLAFAARDLDDAAMAAARRRPDGRGRPTWCWSRWSGSSTRCAPRRSDAVRVALDAGIDVRMITGDHTVTARAIADQLELGPGVITGTELQQLSDDEVIERLPQLHVFGRVAPEDKVRLARLMQEAGEVVAMTGDAVNDAAALKQADIGVAMGSGSEVSKQAAKIVLTDDNFATLVRGRRPRPRHLPTHHVLREAAADGAVLGAAAHAARDDLQHQRRRGAVPDAAAVLQVLRRRHRRGRVHRRRPRPQRDAAAAARSPAPGSSTRPQVVRWLVSGFVVAGQRAGGLAVGPGRAEHRPTPSVSMTMAFAIVALSAVNLGVVMRREREAPWSSPVFPYLGWIMLGWALTWAAVELNMLQRLLDTESLTGGSGASSSACRWSSPGRRRDRQGDPAPPPAYPAVGRPVPPAAAWVSGMRTVQVPASARHALHGPAPGAHPGVPST